MMESGRGNLQILTFSFIKTENKELGAGVGQMYRRGGASISHSRMFYYKQKKKKKENGVSIFARMVLGGKLWQLLGGGRA